MELCSVKKKWPDQETLVSLLHCPEGRFIFASRNKKRAGENIYNLLLLEENTLSLRTVEENYRRMSKWDTGHSSLASRLRGKKPPNEYFEKILFVFILQKFLWLKRSTETDDHRFNDTSAMKQVIAAWYSLQKYKNIARGRKFSWLLKMSLLLNKYLNHYL